MRFFKSAAVVLAGMLPLAGAANAQTTGTQRVVITVDVGTPAAHTRGVVRGPTIMVSCYRGPWQDVIWDRPNTVFIDSLVNAGYTIATAEAVGQRICRDPNGVGSSDRLLAIATQVLNESPPTKR
jgi:hypothetical protein